MTTGVTAARHVLIVGSGSVGKRHARNLAALGCRISCVDPREDRRMELAAETPVVSAYATIGEALRAGGLDGVAVGSPTAFHPGDAIAALEAGLPVLLEKPVAKTADEAREVHAVAARTGMPVLLGYTWRWWPPLRRVRELLAEGSIGAVRHAQFQMSAHLADWHPWEPYDQWFMASAAQGGGALLDESHWIDLMVWLFGMPERVIGRVEKTSGLHIDSDDTVDALVVYPDGLRVSLHLDLYGRPHQKSIRFIGEGGTMLWSAEPNRVALAHSMAQDWHEETFTCERNDMFVAVAEEFLSVAGNRSAPSCTLADGIRVMELIEAIRRSHAEGRSVALDAAP